MSTSTREISIRAPRTGPWIIGYVASLGLATAAASAGLVTGAGNAAPFWIPIIACTVMIIYTSWKRHRLLGTLSPAVGRFWRRFVLSAAFMFASYCALAYGQMAGDWGEGTQRIFLTLPSLGFAGMVWAVHYYPIDESDEYLKSQSVRQICIASFVALIAAICWSAAASLGSVEIGSLGQIVLLWFGGLGVGRLVNEMRP